MKRLALVLSTTLLSLHLQAVETAAEKAAPAAPAAAPAKPARPPGPKATLTNVAYGEHPKQVLDFYKAESSKPTPLVFFIHGGGWTAGSKNGVSVDVASMHKNGISVVSVEYRFIQEAMAANHMPPVEWPLRDAARALQFVRSKAAEWNIDKTRIGATGGSAGACSSLWLAFHAEMGDPKSSDPIARESTRLLCAAVNGAQTSLDPKQLVEWTPNSRYGGHAFGFMTDVKSRDHRFAEFAENREKLLPLIKEYSPYEHVSKDDPAVYLYYTSVPGLGEPQKDPTHTANYGVKLQEKCKADGGACELVYPGAPDIKHKSIDEYLIQKLKQ